MKFTKEEKQAFVKHYQNDETVLQICNKNKIPRSTFYRWIQNYQRTVTKTGTVITPQEFSSLKRKVEKLEEIIQALITVDCTVSPVIGKAESFGITVWTIQRTYLMRSTGGSSWYFLQSYFSE